MKRLFFVLLLLSGACAHSQAVRWNWNANTINSSAPLPGALYPVLASTAAKIQVCTYSATQTCPSLVTTYTNAAESQTCPVTAQLTASQSAICTPTVDAQGTWGIWIAPGTYQYLVNTSYGTFGPYVFSTGGGGAGSGTVTNFSAGNLAPLFTTTVTNSTTTPNLAFSLSNAQSFGFYGNVAGTTGEPSFTTLLAGANVTFTPALGSPNTLTIAAAGGGGTGCTGPSAAGYVLYSTISGGCAGVSKFTSNASGFVDINGGGDLEIDENGSPSNNYSLFDGSHWWQYSDGTDELGGIELHVFDDNFNYGPGGSGPIPYYVNLHVDQNGKNGIGLNANMNCGATTCGDFIGVEIDVNGNQINQASGFEANMTNADSTTASRIIGFLTTPAVGGTISANYCDFAGGRGAGVWAVQIGCGPNSTSTFNGTVQAPIIAPTTLYSAAGTALPACSVSLKGARAVVSDATSPTYMGAYTSGGAITAEVICSYNGTTYSWLTH